MKMKHTLTEKQVLKQLNIPDFRHLSKDKIIGFVSMIPQMDPEVAKKALEQIPDLASNSLEIMREYKEVLNNAIKSSDESTNHFRNMCDSVLNSLETTLNYDLSFEERMYIFEQMRSIIEIVNKKDTETKNYNLKIAGIGGAVALGIIFMFGSSLGVNVNISGVLKNKLS